MEFIFGNLEYRVVGIFNDQSTHLFLSCSFELSSPHTALPPMHNVLSLQIRSQPSDVVSVFNMVDFHSDGTIVINLKDSRRTFIWCLILVLCSSVK